MTFLERWKDFESKVVNVHQRGKNERENMRRCFYAGAIAMLSLMESTDINSDDGGLEQVRGLMNEMNEFNRELQNERPEQRSTPAVRKEF